VTNRHKLQFIFFTAAWIILSDACVTKRPQADWSELFPVLTENNLAASVAADPHKELLEIEEIDAELYGPIAGTMLYLQSPSPTFDSRELTPRYWLRVEDYSTSEAAAKRAAEYRSVATYDRLEKAYRKGSAFMISKTTVREWAIAKGRRVYALTTDTNLFTLIEKPEALRKSIAALAEKR
jgi:hypothetical protein